ncbi:MAG: polysaccharide biosynthesis C-terminal domain-containing protein, partial [Candidatus Omnitrophota bacterium]
MFPMKLAGLALATSLSGINTTLILFYLLIKKIGSFDAKELGFSFLRILLATIAMGLVCFVVSQHKILPVGNTIYRLFELSIQLSIGVISYVIFCFIFRVKEMHELWNWLIKRKL